MIHPETLRFLKDLASNNHKEWFDANRKRYESARNNFLDLVAALIDGLSGFDSDIAASQLDPKRTIMRINRDIRFSKDKTPYKTNFFTFINKEGKKSPYGGYYVSISPEESFFGGGIYMPDNKILAAIRQEIDYNLNEWEQIVHAESLQNIFGEVKPSGLLSRPPKGYEKDHAAVEWLKFKGYYTQKFLQSEALTHRNLTERILTGFRAAKPLVDFINRSLSQ
jgi:uncharacterized protein (TIGR02453 family)